MIDADGTGKTRRLRMCYPNDLVVQWRRRRVGVLCVNHEYNDQEILFPDGMDTWTLEKVRKSQHAHGVSVVEVWRNSRSGQWEVKRPEPRPEASARVQAGPGLEASKGDGGARFS
jgi:secreted PhoX family phosphatase